VTAHTHSPFPPRGGRAGDGGADGPAPGAVSRARRLRKEPTVAERLLWAELRRLKRNIRRQVPIGPYVVDFAHHASRLIIEVDGPVHDTAEAQAKDAARTAWLNAAGYRVIRFAERDVRTRPDEIVGSIAAET
jgi:very-short-patch-repair endonuclease